MNSKLKSLIIPEGKAQSCLLSAIPFAREQLYKDQLCAFFAGMIKLFNLELITPEEPVWFWPYPKMILVP